MQIKHDTNHTSAHKLTLRLHRMNDITTIDDIKVLVNTFYDKVRNHETLGPIFDTKISADQWPIHLEKMYRFWSSILLYTHDYNGSPFDKHVGLPINGIHFAHWLLLFNETIDENFMGTNANIAKERATNIARIFEFKLSTLQPN